MRRLILESTVNEVGRYLNVESIIERLESFEILSLLKEDPKEWAMICRVRMKDPALSFEEALRDDSAKLQHLESQKDGSQIYFLKQKPSKLAAGLFATGGLISVPLEIKDGRMRASFLGSSSEIKRLLKVISKEGLRFVVKSNTDARFEVTSPVALLTEKQRRVITIAFNLGYYDIPKKVKLGSAGEKTSHPRIDICQTPDQGRTTSSGIAAFRILMQVPTLLWLEIFIHHCCSEIGCYIENSRR